MLANNTGGLHVYEAKIPLLLSPMFTYYRLVLLPLTISSTQIPWLSSNPIIQQCKIASPSFKKVPNNETRKAWLSRIDSKPEIFRCSSLRNYVLIFSLVTEFWLKEASLQETVLAYFIFNIFFNQSAPDATVFSSLKSINSHMLRNQRLNCKDVSGIQQSQGRRGGMSLVIRQADMGKMNK